MVRSQCLRQIHITVTPISRLEMLLKEKQKHKQKQIQTDLVTQFKCLFAIAQRRKHLLSSRRRRRFYASLSFVGSIFLFFAALGVLIVPCVYLTTHFSSSFALNAVPASATTFQNVEPHLLDVFSATRARQYDIFTVPLVGDTASCSSFLSDERIFVPAVFDSHNDSISLYSSSFYMHVLDQTPDSLQRFSCWERYPGIYDHPLVVLEFTTAQESPCFVST